MPFTVEQQSEHRAGSRKVGKIPRPSAAWQRKRERCKSSLRLFCLTFFPEKFFLPFSPDHLRVIEKLELVVREGGQFALAMPRASGKTELTKAAALWAILYRYRRFVVIIGAAALHAERIIDDMKSSLAYGDELYAAFPEACHCIRKLEGNVHKARFQKFDDGKETHLEWGKYGIQLARVKGAKCSGAVIRTAGLTGAIRGMSATGPKGETFRPDLVLLDDPQDRESATSLAQTDERERIVRGDVLGLAGKTKTIAAVMPCTVIAEGDLADRFLDRRKNPQWNGERTRRVMSFPVNAALWDKYFDLWAEEMREGGTHKEASEFYRENRKEMDAGAELSWPEAFDRQRFVSAIEEAMLARHENPEAFAAEHQNAPLAEIKESIYALNAKELEGRASNVPRRSVPRSCTRLAAMIDTGGDLLWYLVTAFDENFGGMVIDYGVYPEQTVYRFTKSDPKPALGQLPQNDKQPPSAQIYAALTAITGKILGTTYTQEETGTAMKIERCLIDANWGGATDIVYEFCRRSPHAALLLPSHGKYIGASSNPMRSWARHPGDRADPGGHWRLYPGERGRGRHLVFDTNHWKSFAAERMRTVRGAPGGIFFCKPPRDHSLIIDHFTAEYPVETIAKGRAVDEWKNLAGRDNDWWDCYVGSLVCVATLGLNWSAGTVAGEKPVVATQPRRSWRELQQEAKAKNGRGR